MTARFRPSYTRSERWDSLTVLIPNWTVSLPGNAYMGPNPDWFMAKDDVVDFIEAYATQLHAPVRTGVTVNSLRQVPTSQRFRLESDAGEFEASNVVAATGPFQQPNIPVWSTTLSAEFFQVHSNRYRNPEQLPPGAVLIVESGSSGEQIAEELLAAGRRVYISVGDHRRAHCRYRGQDSAWWQQKLGNYDRIPTRKSRTPCLTGVDGGHDLDLRRMASDGLVLESSGLLDYQCCSLRMFGARRSVRMRS